MHSVHGHEIIHRLVKIFQVPQDLLKDSTNIVKKLIDDLRFSPAPEATAYLQLLGNEIGYLKMSEMRNMAQTLSIYYDTFIKVLPMKVRYIASLV